MDNFLIIVITLLFSAFFSGMEIAFITSNKLKIELDKGKGLFSGRILSAFSREPSRLIGALLLGNNIALVIYGIAMANVLDPLLHRWISGTTDPELLILILQTLIATMLILLVGEFIPKALFSINPNPTLNTFALPLWALFYLLYPLVYLFSGSAEALLKYVLRVRFSREEAVFTPIDLDEYIRGLTPGENREEEVQQEIQMFQNVIDFRKAKVRECMVPRKEIIAVEVNDPIETVREEFVMHGVSRIPVYEDTIDNITGYVHSFDMFRSPEDTRSIIKSIFYVPETMLANVVLTRFIRERQSIAVVVDEFGGTSGLVTMEDVIEEIFGEIEDEFDAEDLVEKEVSENEYIFSARLEIDYLNEKYHLDFPESDAYETLAGFIIDFHESIPEKGEEILIQPFLFEILEASESRIEIVRVRIEKG